MYNVLYCIFKDFIIDGFFYELYLIILMILFKKDLVFVICIVVN